MKKMSRARQELVENHIELARHEARRSRLDDAESEVFVILVELAAGWEQDPEQFAPMVRYVIRRQLASRLAQQALIRVTRHGYARARAGEKEYAALVRRAHRCEELDPREFTTVMVLSAEEEFLEGQTEVGVCVHLSEDVRAFLEARVLPSGEVVSLRDVSLKIGATLGEVLELERRSLRAPSGAHT
jgi:hypothetical protein